MSDEGYVYYLRLGDMVKIGWSRRPSQRISVFGPAAIRLGVEAGSTITEAERHRQFAAHRVAGEWFRWCDELAAHIATLQPVPDAGPAGRTEVVRARVGQAMHASVTRYATVENRTMSDMTRVLLEEALTSRRNT